MIGEKTGKAGRAHRLRTENNKNERAEINIDNYSKSRLKYSSPI